MPSTIARYCTLSFIAASGMTACLFLVTERFFPLAWEPSASLPQGARIASPGCGLSPQGREKACRSETVGGGDADQRFGAGKR
jgi:hypothetical protein